MAIPSKTIDTHNKKINFGKYKGKRWTRVPINYLRWLINEQTSHADIAEAEIKRRGSSLVGDKSVEITGHAIDRASLRLYEEWKKTSLKNEGIHSWLERISVEAYNFGYTDSEAIIYKNIIFVFKKGILYPTLTTVMPAPVIKYKDVGVGKYILKETNFKNIYLQFSEENASITIFLLSYKNDGERYLMQLIDILRGQYPKKELRCVAPINQTIKHILDLKKVDYKE